MIGVQTGAGLVGHADFGPLFRHWLESASGIGGATSELEAFYTLSDARPATDRVWSCDAWREPWLQSLLGDLPDDAARERALGDVAALVAGDADVVITGQQPGFLGGPLYTLYKVAATVVLAEVRTAAGRPTIPVFWSGDDDDDLREALQPVIWDPELGVLLRHEAHGRRGLGNDRMVGALSAGDIASGAASWLDTMAGRNALAGDLAGLWRSAVEQGDDWSSLQRRAMLRFFRGRGLLVVHGRDPLLHGAAEPIYQQLWTRRDALRDAARHGGAQLTASGYSAAVTEPSIQRFLHLGRDGRRQPLAAEHKGQLPPASDLRPGVVARSLVQDWLFQPAGVVVGPGEVAYLKQLRPVYEAFGLPRAPLLPRLFAQLGPAGHGAFRTWALGVAGREERVAGDHVGHAAARVASSARSELLAVLRAEGGVATDRVDALADQVQRRWTRHLEGVVRREHRRRRDDPGAGQAAWLRPDTRRQERALAAFAAAALWGDEFPEALAHASRRYFDAGLDNDWREFLLTVPEP